MAEQEETPEKEEPELSPTMAALKNIVLLLERLDNLSWREGVILDRSVGVVMEAIRKYEGGHTAQSEEVTRLKVKNKQLADRVSELTARLNR